MQPGDSEPGAEKPTHWSDGAIVNDPEPGAPPKFVPVSPIEPISGTIESIDTSELDLSGIVTNEADETDMEDGAGINHAPTPISSLWRFVGKVVLYTALFVISFAAVVALDVASTRLWHMPIAASIILPIPFFVLVIWLYARYLRRADREWSDTTAGELDDETSYSRMPHVSMFLHSISIQAAIWLVSFIAISLLFRAVHVAWYWDLSAQAVVTAVNAYFVTRTYADWTGTRRIIGAEGIVLVRPDLFWLRLRNTPQQNILYSTLVDYKRGSSRLIEKFAYNTRGTVILETQKPESKDGKQRSLIVIRNVSDIDGFMAALTASRKAVR